MRFFMLLLVAGFLLSACATAERGRAFDTGKTAQMEVGKTTEAEVVAMLGAPYRTKTSSNGEKKFRYAHGQATVVLGSIDTKAQIVDILFDQNGIVKAIDKTGM